MLEGLATFPGVPGRMEVVLKAPFRVVIDFAHTGKSLEAALKTLRPTTPGRLLLVVGAAGERDPQRRVDIGRVAARLADKTFFTTEVAGGGHSSPCEGHMAQAAGRGQGVCELVPKPGRRPSSGAILGTRPRTRVLLAGKEARETTLGAGDPVAPWG